MIINMKTVSTPPMINNQDSSSTVVKMLKLEEDDGGSTIPTAATTIRAMMNWSCLNVNPDQFPSYSLHRPYHHQRPEIHRYRHKELQRGGVSVGSGGISSTIAAAAGTYINNKKRRKALADLMIQVSNERIISEAFKVDQDGDTPLHIAVLNRNANLVEQICQLYCKLHQHQIQRENHHQTKGTTHRPLSTVSINNNNSSNKPPRSTTPLATSASDSARPSPTSSKSRMGHWLDIFNYMRQTPLHLAVCMGNAEIVKILLRTRQASVGIADRNGNNSIHLAVKYGHLDCLKLLLDAEMREECRKQGQQQENEQQQQQPHQDNADDDAIEAGSGNSTAVTKIRPIDRLNCDGLSAFHLCLQVTGSELKRKEMIKLLQECGADINVRDGRSGRTPLLYALSSMDVERCVIDELLALKPDIYLPDYSGLRPIDLLDESSLANQQIHHEHDS